MFLQKTSESTRSFVLGDLAVAWRKSPFKVAGHFEQSSTIPCSLWEMYIRMLYTRITRWDTSGEVSGNVRVVYIR